MEMKPAVTNWLLPAIEKSPPTMLTGEAILIPVIVATGEATINVDCGTLVCGAKLNGLGVELPATGAVVTENVPDTPPILTVADVVVKFALEDCSWTVTVWPLETMPGAVVNCPLLPPKE